VGFTRKRKNKAETKRLRKLVTATRKGVNSILDYYRLRNFDGIKLRGGWFGYNGRKYYERTRAALELLKQRAPNEYASVKRHIKKIVFETGGPFGYYEPQKKLVAHYNYVFSNLSDTVKKHVWEKHKDNMRKLEVMAWAGTIYHEAFHGIQFKKYGKKYYKDEDKREAEAYAAGIQVIKKLGAPKEMVKAMVEWKKGKPWRYSEVGSGIRQIRPPNSRRSKERNFSELVKAEEETKKH